MLTPRDHFPLYFLSRTKVVTFSYSSKCELFHLQLCSNSRKTCPIRVIFPSVTHYWNVWIGSTFKVTAKLVNLCCCQKLLLLAIPKKNNLVIANKLSHALCALFQQNCTLETKLISPTLKLEATKNLGIQA